MYSDCNHEDEKGEVIEEDVPHNQIVAIDGSHVTHSISSPANSPTHLANMVCGTDWNENANLFHCSV